MAIRRRKYLNNIDLLKQIHLSKLSYCSVLDDNNTSFFDLIVEDIGQVSDQQLEEARLNRANRLTKLALEDLMKSGMTAKAANAEVDNVRITPEEVKNSDLIIREMTYAHIPEVELKPGKIGYPRLNFPPFKQYRLKGKKWEEVVRSHWEGDFKKGDFNQEHGRLTTELAKMIMLLVERFSQKGHWRGYSYIADMRGEAITHLVDVALKFNEAKSDNPFAFYTTVTSNNFKGFLGSEKRIRNMRDDLMMAEGFDPSFSTMIDHEMAIQAQELQEQKKK